MLNPCGNTLGIRIFKIFLSVEKYLKIYDFEFSTGALSKKDII